MKRKKKYNNKPRDTKWTETPTGRPIDFAEKYADGESGDNKFVKTVHSRSTAFAKKEKAKNRRLRLIAIFGSVALLLIGFIGADVYMIRHSMPERAPAVQSEQGEDYLADMNIEIKAHIVPAMSLDASVMQSAQVAEATEQGETAIAFEAKRKDGTIGYQSKLTTVETFRVIGFPSPKPQEAIEQLKANDIVPVAIIYTYLDNSVPYVLAERALTKSSAYYTDEDSNTYLNPADENNYVYIKDIISELRSMGVTVFVLDGCTVDGKDYFQELTARLGKDIPEGAKFLEAVNVELTGYDAESGDINADGIKSGIKKFPKLGENQIYVISTKLEEKSFTKILKKRKINSYILNLKR